MTDTLRPPAQLQQRVEDEQFVIDRLDNLTDRLDNDGPNRPDDAADILEDVAEGHEDVFEIARLQRPPYPPPTFLQDQSGR